MAVTNGWGQAAVNNTIDYGKGKTTATNNWGEIYDTSASGDTSLGTAAAASLLLDTYTKSAVAYSLRKLSSTYSGSAIRVRRSNDNAEQDIGFSNNELDTTSLTSFIGSNDGLVTTIYDQSGNGNNLTQSTAANQGQIASSGSVNTVNSKPCINLSASPVFYQALSSLSGNSKSFFMTTKNNGADSGSYHNLLMIATSVTVTGKFAQLNSTNASNSLIFNLKTNSLDISTSQAWTSQTLISGIKSATGSSSELFKNGASIGTGTGTQDLETNLFVNRWSNNYANQQLQELIMFDTDESSNRSGIETNINDFYTIF